MRTADAPASFERFLAARGLTVHTLDAGTAVDAMTAWYAAERAGDTDPANDGDMLLFQWGTYDWGEGRAFEFDLTRQLVARGAEGDDDLSQLSLTLRYAESEATAILGSGDLWCERPDEAAAFRASVTGHAATGWAQGQRPIRVELAFGGV